VLIIYIGTLKLPQKKCKRCGVVLKLQKSGRNLEKKEERCAFHMTRT